ncbi:fungal transcriptional regulatory protein [Ophiostoma piceae UAMH 11346]|uniref:Fungal transcriptional regulatory protein n=1 Tax=Ophiostoma piceae (strain UAMH 11346) TaxID=1262450 RepID=S3CBU8_OPHP1|nr:fungal transcriptional regulatory protein [Ophiostoma piceae UAMH 11346]
MVGVPGRSKACATCRRRKKGCDFQRPSCTQCLRAGLECGGYERGRIFVHTTQHRPSTLVSVRESTPTTGNTGNLGVVAISGNNGSGSIVRNRTTSIYTPGLHGNTTGTISSAAPGLVHGALDGPYTTEFNGVYNGAFHSVPIDAPMDALITTHPGVLSGTIAGSLNNALSSVHGNNGDVPPHSPPRLARTSPGSRRMSDQRVIPAQFAAGFLGPPGADSILLGTAREDSLLATFWQSYLPNSSMFPTHAVGFASGGWTNVVQELYRKDPVLHYTLMANCFSAAARIGDSRNMAEQSLRAHGRALHELRLALNHPQKARSDSVFSALRLMIVFSMFFSDRYEEDRKARARGWKEHNAGVLALLRARGPEAHMHGHGHQMFVDCRLALIITSIRLRKKSPLNSHQWMTVPWTHVPKTPKDTLIDILAGLPAVLENVDLLEQMPHDKIREDYRSKIVENCWSYDRQLCAWFETNIPKERLQFVEDTIINNPHFNDNDTLTTEDLSIVYIMSVFLSGCVLLYSTMHSIYVPDLPERANVSMYMNKIVAYLKVGFHPSTGQYGLEMTSFPIGLCLQILSSNLPTGGNITEDREMFMQLLETTRGREIRDFLRSMLNTNVTTQP